MHPQLLRYHYVLFIISNSPSPRTCGALAPVFIRKHFVGPWAPLYVAEHFRGGKSPRGKSCYCTQSSMPPAPALACRSCACHEEGYPGGLLSQVRYPFDAALLCLPRAAVMLLRHGVKAAPCSCAELPDLESWIRSSTKGETANLRPSPMKGLRTTRRWETPVWNQVKGPGHSQNRNLGV